LIDEEDPIEAADESSSASASASVAMEDDEKRLVVVGKGKEEKKSGSHMDAKHSKPPSAAASAANAEAKELKMFGVKTTEEKKVVVKEKVPDPSKDFHAWHEYQKTRWRQIRHKRKLVRMQLENPQVCALCRSVSKRAFG
jgi:hypothetical protein